MNVYHQQGFIWLPVILIVAALSVIGGSAKLYQVQHNHQQEKAALQEQVNSLQAEITPSNTPLPSPDISPSSTVKPKTIPVISKPKPPVVTPTPTPTPKPVVTPKPTIKPTPTPTVQVDSLIKIEKCKVEARDNMNSFILAGKTAINEAMLARMNSEAMSIYYSGGIPGTLGTIVSSLRPKYQSLVDQEVAKLQIEADEIYDKEYLDCLNT